MIGYSPAVRVGDRTLVSGTAPANLDGTATLGDPVAQLACRLAIMMRRSSNSAGQPRMSFGLLCILTDAADADVIDTAHRGVFDGIHPATIMVFVVASDDRLLEQGDPKTFGRDG